jgi:hypothetical protein
MKALKDILTDNDGDFDIVSLMGVLAFMVFFTLEVFVVLWLHKDFAMQDFGIAVAAMLAALGAAYHFKANRPPAA